MLAINPATDPVGQWGYPGYIMERTGKYTIGARVLNKANEPAEGIYAFGRYGLPFVVTNIEKELTKPDLFYIYVIDDLETAQNYIRYLSRLYRFEFRNRAKKFGVPTDEFRFYLLKLTDPRFDNIEKDEECKSIAMKKDVSSSSRYEPMVDFQKIHIFGIRPKPITHH